jgi:hypothetical protein
MHVHTFVGTATRMITHRSYHPDQASKADQIVNEHYGKLSDRDAESEEAEAWSRLEKLLASVPLHHGGALAAALAACVASAASACALRAAACAASAASPPAPAAPAPPPEGGAAAAGQGAGGAGCAGQGGAALTADQILSVLLSGDQDLQALLRKKGTGAGRNKACRQAQVLAHPDWAVELLAGQGGHGKGGAEGGGSDGGLKRKFQ